MKLVFLDLEYNQMTRRIKKPTPMMFEIIEMGFIVTDYNLNELNSFDYLIKPTIQTTLNSHVKELTGIKYSMLNRTGTDFNTCMRRFQQMIGDKFYIITWGRDDVKILKSNCYVKKYPFEFLNNTIHINAQTSYMKIKSLKIQPSLKKISNQYSEILTKEHRSIEDVRRLIAICKEVGITNILSQKEAIVNNDEFLPKHFTRYLENRDKRIKEKLANDLDN